MEEILIKTFVLSLQIHFKSEALLGENGYSEMWLEWGGGDQSHTFHLLSFLIYTILILLKAMKQFSCNNFWEVLCYNH